MEGDRPLASKVLCSPYEPTADPSPPLALCPTLLPEDEVVTTLPPLIAPQLELEAPLIAMGSAKLLPPSMASQLKCRIALKRLLTTAIARADNDDGRGLDLVGSTGSRFDGSTSDA